MALKAPPSAAPASATSASSAPLLPLYLAGLVLVFLGERVVGSDNARMVSSGAGVLAVVASVGLRFARAGQGDADRKRAERSLGLLSLGGLCAVGLYFLTTETGRNLVGVGHATPQTRARFEGALQVTFVSLLCVTVLPLVFGEIALGPMRRAARIEARRVASALRAGVTLGAALVYVSLLTYAAGELDLKVDFSYFRTARPSDSTRKVLASTSEKVKAQVFFPQLNEVGTEVMGYLKDLRQGSPNLEVEEVDRLMAPGAAKEAKVSRDGIVVLSRGGSRETLSLDVEMKNAAGKLKTLDADFQKALLKVMREAKTAYFTVGHGELTENKSDAAEGRTGKNIKKLLESQNYSVKDLGLTQGLGSEVPADATMVVVLGPSVAFLPEEVTALQRYADRGGHLLLGLDPDAKVDLAPLAAIVNLTWSPTLLAHEKALVRRRGNDSDKGVVVSNRFSSHASVSTLSRNAARMPVVFPGASSLEKKDPSSDLLIDFAVKSLGDVFEDKNGDFLFDKATEKRAAWNLVAAVTKHLPPGPNGKDPPELRAFVVADADAMSDAALGNEANVYFTADALRWLGGEESFSGAITNTEDVRIEHTKQKDVIWFYATILGGPSIVAGLGLAVSRRARRRKAAPKPPSDKPKAEVES